MNQNATFQLRNMEVLNKLLAKIESKDDSKNADTSIINLNTPGDYATS